MSGELWAVWEALVGVCTYPFSCEYIYLYTSWVSMHIRALYFKTTRGQGSTVLMGIIILPILCKIYSCSGLSIHSKRVKL